MPPPTRAPEVARRLADFAESAAIMLRVFVDRDSDLVSEELLLESISFARRSEALKTVGCLEDEGVIARQNSLLKLELTREEATSLESMLTGVIIGKSLSSVPPPQLVLTPPALPCKLSEELVRRGPRTTRIEDTRQVFQHLAHQATRRFLVMTPFLDDEGADFLADIFDRTSPDVESCLILRFISKGPGHPGYPYGFDRIRDRLAEQSVSIFDYAIPRDGKDWLETFHAKVVLSDASAAYIGSANINKYSLDNSMEIGVVIENSQSLLLLSDIIETVLSISRPYS